MNDSDKSCSRGKSAFSTVILKVREGSVFHVIRDKPSSLSKMIRDEPRVKLQCMVIKDETKVIDLGVQR